MTKTTSRYLEAAIASAPLGTSGLAIAPWSPDEVYAVAANWTQAAAPVWTYGEDGWQQSAYRVADHQHDFGAALLDELRQSLIASGDDPEDADIADAVAF